MGHDEPDYADATWEDERYCPECDDETTFWMETWYGSTNGYCTVCDYAEEEIDLGYDPPEQDCN